MIGIVSKEIATLVHLHKNFMCTVKAPAAKLQIFQTRCRAKSANPNTQTAHTTHYRCQKKDTLMRTVNPNHGANKYTLIYAADLEDPDTFYDEYEVDADSVDAYAYLKFDKHREPSSYGKNIIYIFTNGLVSFYKFGDADLQSVALLNQIVETLPIYAHDTISIYKEGVYAYFGLSEEGDLPLYDVDFTAWEYEKTPFESFVLDSILTYLASSEYSPYHNINQTITEQQFKKLKTQRRL